MKRAHCAAPGCKVTRRPSGGWWKSHAGWYCSHLHRAIYDTTIGSVQEQNREKTERTESQ